jgi:hypothetical protein
LARSPIRAHGPKSTSTWISSAVAFVATLALTACGVGPEYGAGVTRSAPEQLWVAERSIVVAGPPGYCIDRGLSRLGGAGAFVLLGSCASISGSGERPAPVVPAILTVSVSAEAGDPPDLAELRSYLETPAGRGALSRGGDSSSVTILETKVEGGVLYVLAHDTSDDLVTGMSDTYWRALFVLNGRLVSAAAVGFDGQAIGPDAGLSTLRSLTERLRRENAGGGA